MPRFIARIYGADERELLDYVEDFAQLGSYMHEPMHTYSAGMNARLAFGVSLAIKFDCYLVDEITGAGDERFRARSEEALHERRAKRHADHGVARHRTRCSAIAIAARWCTAAASPCTTRSRRPPTSTTGCRALARKQRRSDAGLIVAAADARGRIVFLTDGR